MVGICDAFAIGAVSLGRRRCPGPLLGLVFSACSGVVLQSVRVGVVVLGSLVLAVWVDLSFPSVRVLYPSLVVAGCLRMLLWASVGRLPRAPRHKTVILSTYVIKQVKYLGISL